MNAITNFFNLILYQPLFNALVLLYLYLPGRDFGIAVIALTILVRFLLYPLMAQSIRSQKKMTDLQPKIQEIQQRCKGDRERQAKETMELYKKENFNPFGGCLPILVQLPFLIAIYQVFWRGFNPENLTAWLYNFVPNPGQIDTVFLGLIDLSIPNIILAIFAGVTQFIQSKMMFSKNSQSQPAQGGQFAQMMQKQTLYFLPIFTILILWRLPSAIGLYWTVSTVFSIVQQYLIFKKPKQQNCPEGSSKHAITK